MDISGVSISAVRSLSISVTGTEYIRRSAAAGVLPGRLPTTQLERDAGAGRVTAAEALRRVSKETVDAIEQALGRASPGATLKGYTDGTDWRTAKGTFLSLIA